MPKDRRSPSLDRCRASPYSHCYTNTENRRLKSPELPISNENEWEETRCPICMEHPHNAVLLLCSSREKGCRPYMCDTSARHSNCLDQFRKSLMNANDSLEVGEGQGTKLVCPLCRGQVNGWTVVKTARHFMNNKSRSCSLGTCDFSGNYSELRSHARRDHPGDRPTYVDPERELEWRSLEEDIEQQDMFSMQFEFDDVDDITMEQLRDGEYELESPLWDYDPEFMHFLTSFDSEFESVFPDIDWSSRDRNLFFDDWTDWDNMFAFSSSHEPETRESGRSRGANRTHSRVSSRPRENSPGTRTNANRRQRATRAARSHQHNHQDQVTTLFEFHDISSDLP